MNEQDFNLTLWKELLASKEKGHIFTKNAIVKRYHLSDRIATCYNFALRHSDELGTDRKLLSLYEGVKGKNRNLTSKLKVITKERDDASARLDFLLGIQLTDPTLSKPIEIRPQSIMTDEITVLSAFGDVHCEERVEAAVVHGLNEYNPDISEKRVIRYFSRLMFLTRMYRKHGTPIKHLVLVVLGDLITGYIHEELMESNFKSPIEASMFIKELTINGLKFLSTEGEFETITIVWLKGNHGRTSARKKFTTGYRNSYEWLMGMDIQQIFTEYLVGYNNLKFIIPRSEFAYFNIYGIKILGGHGDHFGYMGGIGGIYPPMLRWFSKANKIIPVDRAIIGHYHQKISIPEILMNGSVIGYTPFAMGHSFKPEPPQQIFQLVDSKRGFTADVPILLN